MKRHRSGWDWPHAILAISLTLALIVTGCSEDPGGEDYKNRPPQVWISGGPPDGGVSSYKIEFEWWGFDCDGSISHYEYCITNNNGAFDPADTTGRDKWTQTKKTRDTFVFSADQLADTTADDLVEEFRRSHTFFVRAVDDDGAPSARPAYRSFTATTLSPEVEILSPLYVGLDPAIVLPVFTVQFVADDHIDDISTRQDPEAVSWIVEPVDSHDDSYTETIAWIRSLPVDSPEWGDWIDYDPSEVPPWGGSNYMEWTSPPTDYGRYVFAIRARDEAGAITPVFDEAYNVRRLLVSSIDTGPLLMVHNLYFGTLITTDCTYPLVIADVPAGIPIGFEITADASHYGGTVTGYRYGWDVDNPDDPDEWEIDWTPFPPPPPGEPPRAKTQPRMFNFGIHIMRIEVMDNRGLRSCVEVKFNIVQLTMERPVLLVDDYKEVEWSGWTDPRGRGIDPSDEEHDQFWADMLANVDGFDPDADVIDTGDLADGGFPLQALAQYKSVIWNVRSHRSQVADFATLHDLVKFRPPDGTGNVVSGKIQPNMLAMYMAAGGHVLVCGQHPVSNVIDKSYIPDGPYYPFIFAYELDQRQPPGYDYEPTGVGSFAYRDLCLEALDYALMDLASARPSSRPCPVTGYRVIPPVVTPDYLRTVTMRTAIPAWAGSPFPLLELRPETAAPGRAHDPDEKGLDAELFNPRYFWQNCQFVDHPRDCFEPIYGLGCLNTGEVVYGEPVAFWTSEFAHVRPEAPGTVAARSAVFGFPPVFFKPEQVQPALEIILFDEWELPHR